MKKRNGELKDIWVVVQHREGNIEGDTFGLLAEGRRIISKCHSKGTVTAVALGSGLVKTLDSLSAYGADRAIYVESESLSRYHGELFAKVLVKTAQRYEPSCLLMAQNPETADLASRGAALMETALVTRAMDLIPDGKGKATAVRPVANGYLFERLTIHCRRPPIICFDPAVLSIPEPGVKGDMEIVTEPMDESLDDLKTKVVDIIETLPERLDLEEADIIISGGRGMGKRDDFHFIHELAETLGGSVGGTRPVIDRQILTFDRQIGQTGKTVAPRLIITCGVSGANEYTAGMEKSQLVIAIDRDARARIFRFADLGVIGDVQEILPLLISRLKEMP